MKISPFASLYIKHEQERNGICLIVRACFVEGHTQLHTLKDVALLNSSVRTCMGILYCLFPTVASVSPVKSTRTSWKVSVPAHECSSKRTTEELFRSELFSESLGDELSGRPCAFLVVIPVFATGYWLGYVLCNDG